jgi:hypothetical protein
MLRLLPRYLLLSVWLISSTSAIAQQANVQPDAGGCASVEAQRLSFLIGNWKVRSRFRLSREPEKWEETQARSRISFQFEKCLMMERLEGTREGHVLRAAAMYAYNRNSKKYEWVGVDSGHGFLTLYTGSLTGNELLLESTVEISGHSIPLRRVLTKNPAGGFEVRFQRSTDGGRSWDTAWYLVYSRGKLQRRGLTIHSNAAGFSLVTASLNQN